MSDNTAPHAGWLLPVLLSITSAAALGLGFLYVMRPSAGELGAFRVQVTDESGKSAPNLRVVVAEAPLRQNDTVRPGPDYSGIVYYPTPYLTRPNLKLTCAKRHYDVVAETELGFTWMARLANDDFREPPKDAGTLEKILSDQTLLAGLKGNLKAGLVFEDFTWEARGLPASRSALPPKVHEQTGTFRTLKGQEATEYFPVPYSSPPNVQLSGINSQTTIVIDCTAKSFKWRNTIKDNNAYEGNVTWNSKGVLASGESK
jgi:hypothetical protein